MKGALNLANRVTLGRIVLAPIFVVLLLNYKNSINPQDEWLRLAAISVFALAVFTDALDGFIARTRNQKTQLGTFLDPLADKLLLISAIVLLTLPNARLDYRLPFWFAVLAISRDVFIIFGSLLIHVLNGSVRVRPSILGKVTTVSQMIAVIWVLLKFGYPQIPVYFAAFMTLLSGIIYVIDGSRQLSSRELE